MQQKNLRKGKPTFEESEESSDNDAVTWTRSNELRPKSMNVEELTSAVSEDRQRVARSPAASEDRCQVAHSPAASEDSEEHCRVVQGLPEAEESEESTGSEGEDGGTARQDRKHVANRDGTYLEAALSRCQA